MYFDNDANLSPWLKSHSVSISNCSSTLSSLEDENNQKHKPNPAEESAYKRCGGNCFEEPFTDIEQDDHHYSLSCISYIGGSANINGQVLPAFGVERYPDVEDVSQLSKVEREQTMRDIFNVEVESPESGAPAVDSTTNSPSDPSLNVRESFKLNLKKSPEADMSSNVSGKSGIHNKQRVKGGKIDAKVFENELGSAPTFRPMEQEFIDPMKYFRKIAPAVTKYGMCILVPPAGWQVFDVLFSFMK